MMYCSKEIHRVEEAGIRFERYLSWKAHIFGSLGIQFEFQLKLKVVKGGEETNKTWWDVLDFIGINAHYPLLTNVSTPSVNDLVSAWQTIIDTGLQEDEFSMNGGLKNLSDHWNKSILFTEVGFCSGGCESEGHVDLEYQAQRYLATFEAFRSVPWFAGVFWWNWLADPAFGGKSNFCYSPQFKPTEDILRKEFGGDGKSLRPVFPPVCPCIT
jgi:hypothetical protein